MILDGVFDSSCNFVLRLDDETEKGSTNLRKSTRLYFQAYFRVGGVRLWSPQAKSQGATRDNGEEEEAGLVTKANEKVEEVTRVFSEISFDIFLALSAGTGVNLQQNLLDSKIKKLKLKKKRIKQWSQLCILNKIPEVRSQNLTCSQESYDKLKLQYEKASIGNSSESVAQPVIPLPASASGNNTGNQATSYSGKKRKYNETVPPMPKFPSLYNYDSQSAGQSSLFNDSDDGDSRCLLLEKKYRERLQLKTEYGWMKWIMPKYESAIDAGWRQENGWKDKTLKMEGQVSCQDTCYDIDGSLTGIRWIQKGSGRGPAKKCSGTYKK